MLERSPSSLLGDAAAEEEEEEEELPEVLEEHSSSSVFKVFSRFNRDAAIWIAVTDVVLWALAVKVAGSRGAPAGDAGRPQAIRCWSCGCSTGEEAYYLSMIWHRRLAPLFPELGLRVLGTDLSAENVATARRAIYRPHSLKSLPPEWCKDHFCIANCEEKESLARTLSRASGSPSRRSLSQGPAKSCGGPLASGAPWWQLSDSSVLGNVSFLQQDVTSEMPEGSFDVILSRYAVCLYLDAEQKARVLTAMVAQLRPGGFLVIGDGENLPPDFAKLHGLAQLEYAAMNEFSPWAADRPLSCIFRKEEDPPGESRAAADCDDPRAQAASYTSFLRSRLSEPDWLQERERVWRQRVWETGRMSDRSRVLLAKAAREGRHDASLGLLGRMSRDTEERRERMRASQAVHRAEAEESQAVRLPRQEASDKLKCFFERMQRDLANRDAFVKQASKTPAFTDLRPTSKGSRRGRSLAPLEAGARSASYRRGSSLSGVSQGGLAGADRPKLKRKVRSHSRLL